jgi:VanZ family protein
MAPIVPLGRYANNAHEIPPAQGSPDPMNLAITATPALRAICFIGFLGMTAQLLVFYEPNFAVQIVEATWDKAVHCLYFGTMAFLLWIAAGRRWPMAVFLIVAFIGAADETLQAYTPGRSSDVDDWIADALGAATALIVVQRLFPASVAKPAPSSA